LNGAVAAPGAPVEPTVLFIGEASPAASALAGSIGAVTHVTTPACPPTPTWAWTWRDPLERWRADLPAGPPVDGVVVCTWPAEVTATPMVDLSPADWRERVEWPLALWFNALVAAAERCADAGSIVAVVEQPSAVDAAGHGPVVAVADGLLALVRSLAASEGPRRVRVNAVTTELFTAPAVLTGAPPPLVSFPGRADVEVAGAVRMLLSNDSVGITGTVVRAAGGRA
jgi:NAD(P)-dependent dehydrogenase (short-subunit alcohol dehydrogenase family)